MANLIRKVYARNNGTDTITNAQVSYSAPTGTHLVSATPSVGTYDEATGIWTVGDLLIGQEETLSVVLLVTDSNLVSVTDGATGIVDETESDTSNNTASVSTSYSNVTHNDVSCCGGSGIPGQPDVKAFNIDESCTCGSLITNDCSYCQDGSITLWQLVDGSGVNLTEANVFINTTTGRFSVANAIVDSSLAWSFDFAVYCKQDGITYGPIDTATVSGLAIPCSVPALTVNAGTTADATDAANGTASVDLCAGETIHFWSSDGSVNVGVTDGSAIVDLTVTLDIYVDDGSFDAATGILTLNDTDPATPTVQIDLSPLYSTVVDNGNGTITHTRGDGTAVSWNQGWTTVTDNGDGTHTFGFPDATTLTISDTSISTLVDNGDGTYLYTDETGATTTISDVLTVLSYNTAANQLMYTDEVGNANIITLNNATLVDNGNGTYSYTDLIGAVTTFNGGWTTVVDNADGSYTFTHPDGTVVNLSDTSVSTLVDNGDGTYGYTDETGVATTIDTRASANPYDNTTSGLTATTVQAAIDEIDGLIDNIACVDNGNGSFTLTQPDGTTCTFNAGWTTVTDNADGTYTFTYPDGTTVNLSDTSVSTLVDNANGTYTYTDEAGTATTFNSGWSTAVVDGNNDMTITYPDGATVVFSEVVTSLALNGDGQSVDFTDETGATTNLNLCGIVTSCQTTSSLVDNGDGTFTYTDEDGTATSFNSGWSTIADNGDGTYTFTYPDGTNTVISDTSVSTLVNNGNGTYTYTDEVGATTTFNSGWAVSTIDGNNDLTVTYPDGSSVTFAEIVTSISLNGDNQSIDFVDESGVVNNINLCNVVTNCETSSTLAANVDGSFTYTDEDGTITNIPAPIAETITTFTDNGNGTFTYTSEDGTATVLNSGWTSVAVNGLTNVITFTYPDGSTQLYDETLTSISHAVATNQLTFNDESGSANVINLPVTSLALGGDNQSIAFTNELGVTNNLNLSTIVDNTETVTTLAYNAAANTLTFTDEDGSANALTLNSDVLTTLTLNGASTGLTYTDEGGTAINLDLCPVVDNCETVTSISYAGGTGTLTYNDEDGVATNIVIPTENFLATASYNAATTTLTLTLTDATTFDVDLSALVSTTVVQVTDSDSIDFTITGDGSTGTPFDITGVTKLDTVTGGGNNALSSSANGLYVAPAAETTTTLVDNGNGTYTYTNEAAATTTFASGWTVPTINANNSITFTQPDGTLVNYDETLTSLTYNAVTHQFTYTDEGGTASLMTLGKASVVDNANGTYTFTDEVGAVTTIDICAANANCTLFTVSDGTNASAIAGGDTFNLLQGDGVSVVVTAGGDTATVSARLSGTGGNDITFNAGGLYFSETTTSLTLNGDGQSLDYTDEDGTVSNLNLCAAVTGCETTTTLTYNSVTDTLTYTDEDGVATNIALTAAAETTSTLVDNGNATFTYTDETGAVTNYSEVVTSLAYNAVTNQLTYSDESGANSVLTLNGETTTTLVDNANGSFTYTNELGAAVTWNETTTSLAFNAVTNQLTYTDEDGTAGVLTLNTADGSETDINAGTNVTITGTGTTADPYVINSTDVTTTLVSSVPVGNAIGVYTNELGAAVTLNETVTSLAYNAGTQDLTYTKEDGTTNVIDLSALVDAFVCTDLNTCSVGDLSDVDLTGIAAGNVLSWNGAQFVPAADAAGEINTGSNLGAGEGVFSAKVGVDLQFKSLLAGTNVTLASTGTDITINATDTNTTNASLAVDGTTNILTLTDSATGTVTVDLSHLDDPFVCTDLNTCPVSSLSDVNYTAPANGDISYFDGTNWVNLAAGAAGTFLQANGAAAPTWAVGGAGEVNTGSNVGTDGVGVFNSKVGVDLQFRHIAPEDAKITVALNGNDIDVGLGAVSVLDLSDTPAVMGGAGQILRVNLAGTALEFAAASDANTTNTSLAVDGTSNVLTLTDSDANTVTVDLSHLDDPFVCADLNTCSITDLADTPGALGTAGQILAMNLAGTALEWTAGGGAETTTNYVQGAFAGLLTGRTVGTYTNEGATAQTIQESITTLVDNANGTYTYTSENNTQTIIDVCGSLSNCTLFTVTDGANPFTVVGGDTITLTSADGSVAIDTSTADQIDLSVSQYLGGLCAAGATSDVADGDSDSFIVVPAELAGKTLTAMQIKSIGGGGTANVSVLVNGAVVGGPSALAGGGSVTVAAGTVLASGDYIQLRFAGTAGSVTGVGATAVIN